MRKLIPPPFMFCGVSSPRGGNHPSASVSTTSRSPVRPMRSIGRPSGISTLPLSATRVIEIIVAPPLKTAPPRGSAAMSPMRITSPSPPKGTSRWKLPSGPKRE